MSAVRSTPQLGDQLLLLGQRLFAHSRFSVDGFDFPDKLFRVLREEVPVRPDFLEAVLFAVVLLSSLGFGLRRAAKPTF